MYANGLHLCILSCDELGLEVPELGMDLPSVVGGADLACAGCFNPWAHKPLSEKRARSTQGCVAGDAITGAPPYIVDRRQGPP